MQGWIQYLIDSFNQPSHTTLLAWTADKVQEELKAKTWQIMNEEMRMAITNLRSTKPAGVEKIPAELLKYCGHVLVEELMIPFNKCWRQVAATEDWRKVAIVKLP